MKNENKKALQTARETAGLSQSQLANASGVSVRLIQAYEQGERDIRKAAVETVERLAKALNCKIEDII